MSDGSADEWIAHPGAEAAARLRRSFEAARPFAHLVIDDFLTPAGRAALADAGAGFPGPDWRHWSRFFDEYQKEKRVCGDIRLMPAPLADLIRRCCEPAFLQTLEAVTGIGRLIPDPYLDGGGLHMSGGGGVLAPHTDFHLYKRLDLYRVINLLIYFNEDWTAGDGGRLELYGKGEGTASVSVIPTFGRAVIFRTDDASIHGFTEPVASGKWRRSVALYYYTSRESGRFRGDTATHWRTHGSRMTGARLAAFEGLILGSRALSRMAHLINPNRRAEGEDPVTGD
jgi:hypothetical protein